MDLRAIKNRIRKLGPRPGQRRKPTTSETRQELDRILAKLESLPTDAPPHPDTTGLAAAEAELDRMLAVIDKRAANDARWWATPWNDRHGAL
jgi:hypothetical protein